jgi:hypothetical protein
MQQHMLWQQEMFLSMTQLHLSFYRHSYSEGCTLMQPFFHKQDLHLQEQQEVRLLGGQG